MVIASDSGPAVRAIAIAVSMSSRHPSRPIQHRRLAAGSRRSIRAAMTACGSGGRCQRAQHAATITRGVLMADDAAVTDLTDAVQIAERCSEDLPLVVLRMTLGTALTYRDSAGRERGVAMLAELRDTCIKERYGLNMVPTLELYIARTTADEDIDGAIQQTRAALEEFTGGAISPIVTEARAFSFNCCWRAVRRTTCWRRRPRSTGWWAHWRALSGSPETSSYCNYVRCWPGRAGTTLFTGNTEIATAQWRMNSASRATCNGRRRWLSGGEGEGGEKGEERVSNTAIAALWPPMPDTAPPRREPEPTA